MTTPRTVAGKALLDDEMDERFRIALGEGSLTDEDQFAARILAIEAEAAPTVERLAEALLTTTDGGTSIDTEYEWWLTPREFAVAILAALAEP